MKKKSTAGALKWKWTKKKSTKPKTQKETIKRGAKGGIQDSTTLVSSSVLLCVEFLYYLLADETEANFKTTDMQSDNYLNILDLIPFLPFVMRFF